MVTAVALLLYPGYGILFHMLSSDSICAFVFAVWALALTRASLEPTTGRFALLGLATAAAALTRPGYQVLAVFALVPLVLALTWRRRLAASAAFLGVVVGLLGAWTVNNGVRYDDYALARGGGAFFPFYRAFTTDRIVSPENGEASRELADAVRTSLLDEEPYRSYGITLERFFEGGGPREFEDVVGITDRVWGWETDYAQMREVGVEAVRSTSVALRAGRDRHGPRRALESSARCASSARTPRADDGGRARTGPSATDGLPPPSEGEQIPSARQGFFSTTPDGSITEVWTSPTDHSLVFSTPEAQRRFEELDAESGRLSALVPPYPGNAWLTLQFSRSSKLFPPPLSWLGVGIVAWLWRRPARRLARGRPCRRRPSRPRVPGAGDLLDHRVRRPGCAGARRLRRRRSRRPAQGERRVTR